jgi:uracil-DNA glycosylase
MIDDFVAQLANTAVSGPIFNQYDHSHAANAARRHNLRRYLEQMAERRPAILLVAEAPGYRGARLSGVPFASRRWLRQGVTGGLFRLERGYRDPAEWPDIRGEASATMMWEGLRRYAALPLLWNTFPFHPHRPGKPRTNRRPTHGETAVGESFLRRLLRRFPINAIIAVGNHADQTLDRWSLPHHHVRHPSHGGKADFLAGLDDILAA